MALAVWGFPWNCQSSGSSPLWIASQEGHMDVAEALLAAGASVNVRNTVRGVGSMPSIGEEA